MFHQSIPTIDSAFVKLTYKISKQPWAKSEEPSKIDGVVKVDPLIFIALMGCHVQESLELAVKTGKGPTLKQLSEHFLATPHFDQVIVPAARNRFSQLRPNYLVGGPPSEAKVKQLVSPVMMVLLHRPGLLEAVIEEYFHICEEGARFFESKLEILLQNIVKGREKVEELCHFVFSKYKENPEAPRIQTLLRSVVSVAKLHGSYYKTLVDFLVGFAKAEPQYFAHLRPELDVQVLFDFIILVYETDLPYFLANIKDSYSQWNIRLEDFFKFVAFTEKQSKNFELCARFCADLIDWYLEEIQPRTIFKALMNEYHRREGREFPVMLAHIAYQFAKIEKGRGQSVEPFLEAFKEGIAKGLTTEPIFWKALIQYSRFEKVVTLESLRPLLSEDRYKQFSKELNA